MVSVYSYLNNKSDKYRQTLAFVHIILDDHDIYSQI